VVIFAVSDMPAISPYFRRSWAKRRRLVKACRCSAFSA